MLYQGTAQERRVRSYPREKGQIMFYHDRDAEIAAFIDTKGVIRCPTACVAPTQGSPDPADQAALEQHAIDRDQLRRMKFATRNKPSDLAVPQLHRE